MTYFNASEVRKIFSDILNKVAYRGERIILRRSGKDVAAMVPISDLKIIEALENRMDLDDARAALADADAEGTVPWERLKAELGL